MTTDRRAQFEFQLFRGTLRISISHRSRATAYHLTGNGTVERFPRQLSTSLAAFVSANWVRVLLTDQPGLQSAFKSDITAPAAKFVYNRIILLPED